MQMTTAYAIAWLSTSIAVITGVIISHSLVPLWALLIPACISVKQDKS